MGILGNEVIRVEDPRMLTEGGKYVGDLVPDDTTWVTFVRSTVAHARLTDVDTTEAASMPGVLGVFSAADFAQIEIEPMPMFDAVFTRPPLARDVVRFVGEPIVALVTETVEQGVDAAEMVFVDYEPLPVVVDPAAARDGDVKLFDAAESNVCFALPGEPISFDQCDVVATATIANSRIAAGPIEPRVASARRGDDGRLVCLSSTQGAHPARETIANGLGIEQSDVRVIIPDVGGGFGAKAGPSHEEVVLAALTDLVGRPTSWAETRTENLLGMGHGRAQTQTITLGGTAEGDLTHYRLEVLQDTGAYAAIGGLLPMFTGMMATGVYDIPNVEYSSVSVVTNTAPIGAFRGAGRPEAAAAIERAVDLFAAEAGLDPVQVRRRNYIAPDAFPFTTPRGATYDCGDYEGSLDKALAVAGYDALRVDQAERRARGDVKQLGIGLATYVEITAPGGTDMIEHGSVELMPDGSILAVTGSTPYGQGHVTAWKMVIADRTGVPMDRIEIVHGDTDAVVSGGITGGSRSAQLAGSALYSASEHLVDAGRRLAAELLEAAVDDIVLDDETGNFHVVGTPARSVDWAQVAGRADEPLECVGDFVQAQATFPFGTHVCVVEVDTDTGGVEVVRYIACDDAGTLLNPLIAQGQVHGGLGAGIAQGLLEEVRIDDDGNLLTSNFADYPLISATELPSFELVIQETPTPLNPLGAKGIGESGTVGATPAVTNAVVDALAHLGIRHIDMPATPEKVWRAVDASAAAS